MAHMVFGKLYDAISILNYKAVLNLYVIKDLLIVN